MVAPVREQERGALVGQTLNKRYRIVRCIGGGGTGIVFEACSLPDGSSVAIKTLRPCFVEHPDLGRRLQREAEVARRVRHPGIVPVLDEGTLDDGSPFLVMPLLAGESLSRVLLRTQTLPVEIAALIAARVAAILHGAHCMGYVHRDVKPDHILLDIGRHGDLLVSLLDFGVCASGDAPREEREREQGKVFGTPTYVSPEQAAGRFDVDARADLFSLGVVMFESLSGRPPFADASVSKLLLRIIREEAPRVSEVVPNIATAIDDVVARLLARDPEDRFPSARALGRVLTPHVGERGRAETRMVALLRAGRARPALADARPAFSGRPVRQVA